MNTESVGFPKNILGTGIMVRTNFGISVSDIRRTLSIASNNIKGKAKALFAKIPKNFRHLILRIILAVRSGAFSVSASKFNVSINSLSRIFLTTI